MGVAPCLQMNSWHRGVVVFRGSNNVMEQLLSRQDISLPCAATERPGAVGVHVCACLA